MVLESENGKLRFNKQLLLHIERKNNDKVRSILINDDACKASDSMRVTLLHFASEYGNAEIVQYLIDSGINVNAQDILGRTPLLLAVIHSDSIETIANLLKANADFLKVDIFGRNPLQWGVDKRFDKEQIHEMFIDRLKEYCRNDASMIADLLVKAKCSIEAVVWLRDSTITEMVIKAACDVNAGCSHCGPVALHLAVQHMDVENVKVLIKYGADVTATIRDDHILPLTSYLSTSVRYPRKRNREVMKLLMKEYFAAPDKDFDTMVSTQDILLMGDEEDIRYMLQYDVDFSATDPNGSGVLHYLASNFNPNVTKPFDDIIGKFDVNMRNSNQISPLYQASLTCNPSTVQFLLDNGADVNTKADMGATPLVAVIRNTWRRTSKNRKADERKVLEILLQRGADVQVMWGTSHQNLKTLFDVVAAEETRSELGELLMARLVFLEKLGKPIVDLILSQIDGDRKLKNKYNLCKRQLEKMEKTAIHESITLFDLLKQSEEEIARCQAYNWELLPKLEKFDANYRSSSYYYDTLRDRISSALQKIKLINDATDVIFNQLAPQLNENYLLGRNIIDYLNYEDMRALNKI